MGPVMRTASMKPEVALLDNEDMQDIEGDVDWQFVALGEQKNFGIKTAGTFKKYYFKILFKNQSVNSFL